jgi:type IV secretory pathway VirB9-like protein
MISRPNQKDGNMRYRVTAGLLLFLAWGCAKEDPLPPVPPPPEDLSHWTVPELVQPPADPPAPLVPVEDKPTPAERVYAFVPGTTFAVTVGTDAPLDILLARGEQVRNIVGVDRASGPGGDGPPSAETNQVRRWEVKEGADGLGDTLRSHLFLTASAPGLTTGMIITTTHRIYYLRCKSVKTSPTRAIRWTYAPDTTEKPLVAKAPGLLPNPLVPARYHVGYEITSTGAHPPAWLPRQIVDDGKKVYIVYPEVTLFDTVPLVRLIGPNGPQLVNARQFLNVVIVDQLVGRAELRVGLGETAETVTITRGTLRTIACPSDEACPVWPHAAQLLAQKGGLDRQPPQTPAPLPPVPPPAPASPPAPPVPPKPEEGVPPASAPQGETP